MVRVFLLLDAAGPVMGRLYMILLAVGGLVVL